MLSRKNDETQSTKDKVWNGIKWTGNLIPAVSLIASRIGNAAFNGLRSAGYILQTPNISKSPTLASWLIVVPGLAGAGVTNIVTRFFNLYRRSSNAIPSTEEIAAPAELPESWTSPSPSPRSKSSYQKINNRFIDFDDEEEKGHVSICISEENSPLIYLDNKAPLKPSFFHPGDEQASSINHSAYIALQFVNVLYCSGGALSAYLSMRSIAQLLSKTYEDSCDSETNKESAAWIIGVVYALTAIQMHANIKSFNRYNWPLCREYWQELITNEHWRDINGCDYAAIFGSSILGSINIFYANTHLIPALKDGLVCNIANLLGTTPSISEGAIKALSLTGAGSNFITNSLMTAGATYRKKNNQKLTEDQPVFGILEKPIQVSVYLNGLNIALGMFVAVTALPEKLFDYPAETSYHPAVMALAAIAAIIVLKNQVALDQEGVARERHARIQQLKSTTENLADDRIPLLNDSEDNNDSKKITKSRSFQSFFDKEQNQQDREDIEDIISNLRAAQFNR